MTTYKKQTTLFCGAPASDDMVQSAKDYCARNGFSNDDVGIYQASGSVFVQTKRDLTIVDDAVQPLEPISPADLTTARPSSQQPASAARR